MTVLSYLRSFFLLPINLETIMTTQAELAASLTALADTVGKIKTETQSLVDRVAELTQAVEDAKIVSPEVQAALAAVQSQVAAVDALVPDAPAPEEPTEPETPEEPVDPELPGGGEEPNPAP